MTSFHLAHLLAQVAPDSGPLNGGRILGFIVFLALAATAAGAVAMMLNHRKAQFHETARHSFNLGAGWFWLAVAVAGSAGLLAFGAQINSTVFNK